MKKIITFLLLLVPFAAISQNLTGTWEGSGGGTTYIRMVIKHRGDSLFGYTYDEGSGYCKAWFLGRYNKAGKRLVGRGTEMIEHTSNHVLVDYDLVYSKEEDGEYLRESLGEVGFLQRLLGSNNRQYLKKTSNKISLPRKTSVKAKPPLTRPPVARVPEKKTAPVVVKKEPVKKTVPATKPVAKKTTPVSPTVVPKPVIEKKVAGRSDSLAKIIPAKKAEFKPASAALIKKKDERTSKLVQTIYTSVDTVKMYVYDNGEVDGDTVTVFFDNSVILNRYRISDKAKELFLPVSKNGEQHTIELFANNLGTIPPNTALIIIMTGSKRYELRASYDFHTNAKIIIQYKE